MNRKAFLNGVWPLALGVPALARGFSPRSSASATQGSAPPVSADVIPVRIPPYLQTGDLIGICCGSGHIDPREVQPSRDLIQGWGFRTVLGQTVGEQDGMFGGSDAQRTKDIQEMLDNPEIRAILFARGGYGLVRIIDNLDFRMFGVSPKWLIGFSDVTVIHAHVHTRCHVATLHSKMLSLIHI